MIGDYQVNIRRLTMALIRTYAFFQFVTMAYGLAGLSWYLFKHSADVSQEAAIYQDLRDQVIYVLLNSAFLILIYFQAWRISGWVFGEDEVVAWSGDPFALALPALQITGLVFLTKGLAGLVPVIQTFYLHQESSSLTAFEPQFWNDAWAVFLQLLLGFLFFRNPRWLVDKMRRFSKEAH